MMDRSHDLSVARQPELLDISRGSVYYLPRPTSPSDLALMRRIDELHLDARIRRRLALLLTTVFAMIVQIPELSLQAAHHAHDLSGLGHSELALEVLAFAI